MSLKKIFNLSLDHASIAALVEIAGQILDSWIISNVIIIILTFSPPHDVQISTLMWEAKRRSRNLLYGTMLELSIRYSLPPLKIFFCRPPWPGLPPSASPRTTTSIVQARGVPSTPQMAMSFRRACSWRTPFRREMAPPRRLCGAIWSASARRMRPYSTLDRRGKAERRSSVACPRAGSAACAAADE